MAGFWDALRSLPLRFFAPNVTYVGARSDAINELMLGGVGNMTVATMWRTQPHLRTVVSFLARNVAHLGLQRLDFLAPGEHAALGFTGATYAQKVSTNPVTVATDQALPGT